jgi:CTP synthase
MRLGAYHCVFMPGSRIRDIYGKESVMERHRHRFEFTMRYRQIFEENGMKIGGIYPRNNWLKQLKFQDTDGSLQLSIIQNLSQNL